MGAARVPPSSGLGAKNSGQKKAQGGGAVEKTGGISAEEKKEILAKLDKTMVKTIRESMMGEAGTGI